MFFLSILIEKIIFPFFHINNERLNKIRPLLAVIQKIIYSTSIYSIYFIFWLRQKLFYLNNSISYMYTKNFWVGSWAVLAFLTVCYISQNSLSILCFYSVDKTDFLSKQQLEKIQIFLSATNSTCTHFALLPLFVYPLIKHRLQTSKILQPDPTWADSTNKTEQTLVRRSLTQKIRSSMKSNVSVQGSSLKTYRRYEIRMLDLIKRCCFITFICIFVNLTANIVTCSLYLYDFTNLAIIFYGFNLLINIFCSVGVLRRCRKILLPFCLSRRKRKRNLKLSAINQSTSSQSGRIDYRSVEI